jgi:hypothetical protein
MSLDGFVARRDDQVGPLFEPGHPEALLIIPAAAALDPARR